MRISKLLLGGGFLATLATVVARGASRIVVSGDSMRPALEPGDRLLVRRTHRPLPGDVVAATDPRQPDRILVKRLVTITDDGAVLVGDNPVASTDSRHFGVVDGSTIIGVAVYRYAPAARSGRVVRRPVPSTEWPMTASTHCSPRSTSTG
jgi:nickel-type superoxide dismutase maturation protease